MSVESIRIEGIDTPVSRIGLGTWAIGGWMWGRNRSSGRWGTPWRAR